MLSEGQKKQEAELVARIQKDSFGPRYVGFDFDETKMDPALKSPVQKWLKNPIGFCIISGTYGCGKTVLGSSLIPYMRRKFVTDAYYLDELKFFSELKRRIGYGKGCPEEWIDYRFGEECQFTFYDDLGSVPPKLNDDEANWRKEMILALVNLRYTLHGSKGKRYFTLMTTNLDKDAILATFGERIADRLLAKENLWIDAQSLSSLREHGL